jgi:UDP-N-acetylmuramoyl-L-alanyl-D-glutamate--2,6-diaminopimelate ligase
LITTGSVESRLREKGVAFTWSGRPPEGFASLRVDSRRVATGDLFCAIAGTEADGHDYVATAAASGAFAAIVERDVEATIPLLRVSDTRIAAAHLSALAADDPAARLRIAGITGTNGKTTTALILRHLLGANGKAAALGTLGLYLPDGTRRARGRMTTPGPLELTADLDEAADAGAEWLAMEVSSHALDQHRVEALEFVAATFTNLSREHLDYHPDMVSYREAKLGFVARLAEDGVAVVNADDPAWHSPVFDDVRVVMFGLGSEAAVRATHVQHSAQGSKWRLETPSGSAPVALPLLGEFNVSNALAAAATAWALGFDVGGIASRLASAPQVPGRMETLAGPPGPLVLRDYAHTPDGLSRALAALRELTDGRLSVVFGCGGDRDRGKRPLMGRTAAEGADRVILTTDNPRTEALGQIIGDIVADLPPNRCEVIEDRAEAIGAAVAAAEPGDVVLLAGKGHETYQDIQGEKIPFDEAAVVARLAGEGR